MMKANNFDWNRTKQLSAIELILAFVIPSIIAFVGFRMVLPVLVEGGIPSMIAWPAVASVMLLALVVVAFVFLRSEARQLNISLASRMCLKSLSVKQWITYLGIIVLGLIIAGAAAQLVVPFMNVTGLSIPNYMPFFLNPTINPVEAEPTVLSPGFLLKGQFILILLMGVALLLNIVAEELYFRAWILPKMSKYGKMSWVLNASLFALYHSFQFWLLPTILVGSLVWAFVTYKSRSTLPSLLGHFIGNFLFGILVILMLVLG